jgi:hypothetical protein
VRTALQEKVKEEERERERERERGEIERRDRERERERKEEREWEEDRERGERGLGSRLVVLVCLPGADSSLDLAHFDLPVRLHPISAVSTEAHTKHRSAHKAQTRTSHGPACPYPKP